MLFPWNRLLLFALGAVLCVLVYLFLLNFPGLGRQGPGGGLVAVLVLAASTWWLTIRFLRADGMSLSDLGLSAADSPLAHLGIGLLSGSALTGLWLGLVTVFASATWHPNPAFRTTALLTACVFNFFNNVNFNNPTTNLTSGNFGKITSARDPRIMQFGAKILF